MLRWRKTYLTLGAVAGALWLVTACTVGPNYVRPTVLAPVAYKEMESWKVAQPKDETIRGAWWEIFQDPLLNSLEERVNISNQNLAAAEAQVRQAQAAVQAARASYFPTISIGASVANSRQPTSLGGGAATRRAVTDYSLPLQASWELDLWGRIRRTVESQQASAEASQADLESTRLSAQVALAQSYFALRVLDAQRHLLDATVADFQKSLDLTQNRYASGVASRADVVQADTQHKTAQAQAIDIEVQRAQLEHAIATLTGTPSSDFSLSVAPLTAAPPAIPVGVPSELLERRPDIAAAERQVAASNAQIGVAVAAYFPTITLSGSAGFLSTSLSDLFSWPSRVWAVGAAIAETVFEGGLRRAQTNEARAADDASVAAYRQVVLTAFQAVEDNLAALRILEEEARVQDEAVKAAEQSVTLTTNQYKAGTVSYLNVITAQTIALSNEVTGVQILGRRMAATVLLIDALGGGWNVSTLQSANVRGGNDSEGPQSSEGKLIPADRPRVTASSRQQESVTK
jgi:NodT family efflux transporter outer membrane factor (OMF) lipoprotein